MKKLFATIFLCASFLVPNAFAHDFSWDNVMLAAVKLDPAFDYQGAADTYMEIYTPEVWNSVKNDEFELQDKRDEAVKMLKDKVDSFSLDEEFVIDTAMAFKDYDFDKGVFPVEKFDPNTYFYVTNVQGGKFAYKYQVFISNPDYVKDLDMDKNAAKGFLQSRKNSAGAVDRTIGAKLRFRITKLTKKEKFITANLEAEIVGITTYADPQRATVLQDY
jgi:hypothetical protein